MQTGTIREIRWVVYCDKNGKESEPVLQQRNGNYGYWRDVPVIKSVIRWNIKKGVKK